MKNAKLPVCTLVRRTCLDKETQMLLQRKRRGVSEIQGREKTVKACSSRRANGAEKNGKACAVQTIGLLGQGGLVTSFKTNSLTLSY